MKWFYQSSLSQDIALQYQGLYTTSWLSPYFSVTFTHIIRNQSRKIQILKHSIMTSSLINNYCSWNLRCEEESSSFPWISGLRSQSERWFGQPVLASHSGRVLLWCPTAHILTELKTKTQHPINLETEINWYLGTSVTAYQPAILWGQHGARRHQLTLKGQKIYDYWEEFLPGRPDLAIMQKLCSQFCWSPRWLLGVKL